MGRSRRSTSRSGEPTTWGRATAKGAASDCQVRRRAGEHRRRRLAEFRSGVRGGTEDSEQTALLGGRRPRPPFDDLYNLVCDPTVLTMAWERVAGNKGSRTAGTDRATVAWIVSRYGVETFLHEVRDPLRSRTFTPAPVRRVMIPKASGKLRALGIPTVTDRVVQAALKLVLEPIFEADFQPVSYGFRPNRRAQDAIAEIHHFTTKSYQWVLEADIEAFFDNIDHLALMDRLRARIKDKRVLALVKAFLKAGVPRGHRQPGRQHHRHSARRDPLPAAGQHRPVRAG